MHQQIGKAQAELKLDAKVAAVTSKGSHIGIADSGATSSCNGLQIKMWVLSLSHSMLCEQ